MPNMTCSHLPKYRWRLLFNAIDQIVKIFAPGKISLADKSPQNIHLVYQPEDGQTLCKVWLTSAEWRRCSNKAKTQNPLKFAWVSQTCQPISSISGLKFTILWAHVEEILLFNKFFSDCQYISCEDIARQRCVMVHRFLHPVFSASLVQHI